MVKPTPSWSATTTTSQGWINNHSPNCYCLLRSPCNPRLWNLIQGPLQPLWVFPESWTNPGSSPCEFLMCQPNPLKWIFVLLQLPGTIPPVRVSLWYRSLTCFLYSKILLLLTQHLFIESVHLQQRNTFKIPIKLRTMGLEAKLILLHQVKNDPLNVMMPAMFGFYIYTSGIQFLTKLKALIRSLPESKNSPERKQTAGFYSVGNLLNVDI